MKETTQSGPESGGAASRMHILLVDDHPMMRKGLIQLLSREFDSPEISEASDSKEALALAERKVWNLAILDLNLPGRSGFEVLQELKSRFPQLPVLIFSAYPEEMVAMRALEAGASGYLSKLSPSTEMVIAIRKVLSGGSYVSAALAEQLAGRMRRGVPQAAETKLSARELEVMAKLAAGRSIKEIAAQLSLSVKTISTFRARLLRKLDLHNNVELAFYAVQRGIVERPDPSGPVA